VHRGYFHDIIPKPEFGGCRRTFAFGHDEVAPLSQEPLDSRNGWGATIVDSMSTMVRGSLCIPYDIELTNDLSTSWDSQYDRLLAFLLTMPDGTRISRTILTRHSTLQKALTSRNRTPPTPSGKYFAAAQLYLMMMASCSLFESTIRYIGGLISAYELSGKEHKFLIDKAKQLADRLSLAWSHVSVFGCANQDLSDLKHSRATRFRLETLTSAPIRSSIKLSVAAEQRSSS